MLDPLTASKLNNFRNSPGPEQRRRAEDAFYQEFANPVPFRSGRLKALVRRVSEFLFNIRKDRPLLADPSDMNDNDEPVRQHAAYYSAGRCRS